MFFQKMLPQKKYVKVLVYQGLHGNIKMLPKMLPF